MRDESKLYLYAQCRRFAAADCPDALASQVEDIAHHAFLKALAELPHLRPQPGKTLADCLEALACLRVIDACRQFSIRKARMLREAAPVSPTDVTPEGDEPFPVEILLPASHDAMDEIVNELDAHFLPDWVRELRRVRDTLHGRDRRIVNAILAESNRTRRVPSLRQVRRNLGMCWREFSLRRARLRRRFRHAWDLFLAHQRTR